MKKALYLSLIAMVLCLLASTARADLVTIDQPNPLNPTWDVWVNNLPPGIVVAGFTIDLGYNSGALTPNHVDYSLLLGDPGLGEAMTFETISPFVWEATDVSLLGTPFLLPKQNPPASFILATFYFDPVPGTAGPNVELTYSLLSDQYGNQIGGAPIPEPGTMLLLGSGMAALARWRKKLI